MSKTYRDAVVALHHWQYRRSDCFSDKLFDLFRKADPDNKQRLTIAFPNEAQALEDWEEAADYGNALFRQHGIMEYGP